MRIGIITHNYPAVAGERKDAGTFIRDFAHALSKEVDVRVFCLNFEGKIIVDNHIPVTTFTFSGSDQKLGNWNIYSPISHIKFLRMVHEARLQAKKFARDNEIDYCLAAWTIPAGLVADILRFSYAIPFGVWTLGSDINKYANYPILRQLIKRTLNSAETIFCNGSLMSDKIKHLTGRTSVFLPSVTNFDLPLKRKARELNKKKIDFLFIGRLERVKGPDLLIEACQLIKISGIPFTVTIAGDGTMRDELAKKIIEYKLENSVKIVGPVDKEGVAKLMNKADCLVIPSRNESLPLVLLEASKAHLPVIATNVGDCGKLIKKYKTGYVIKAPVAEEIAQTMIKAHDKRRSLYTTSLQGFEKINILFTQEYAVNIFLNSIKKHL